MTKIITLCLLSLALTACGGAADEAPDSDTEAPASVVDGGADSGVLPEPDITCCILENERGERLNYMCGEAINVAWAEERGYRCWLVQ